MKDVIEKNKKGWEKNKRENLNRMGRKHDENFGTYFLSWTHYNRRNSVLYGWKNPVDVKSSPLFYFFGNGQCVKVTKNLWPPYNDIILYILPTTTLVGCAVFGWAGRVQGRHAWFVESTSWGTLHKAFEGGEKCDLSCKFSAVWCDEPLQLRLLSRYAKMQVLRADTQEIFWQGIAAYNWQNRHMCGSDTT